MADRTLNVPDPQILQNFAADAGGFFWHHRLLLARVRPGVWIGLSPDLELANIDLNVSVHEVCGRSAPFPAHINAAEIYCFDPLRPEDLVSNRRLAKLQASLLGEGPVGDTTVPAWRFAEVSGKYKHLLGEPVPDELVTDDTLFASIGNRGLVQHNEEILVCEAITDDAKDEWLKGKMRTEVDVRVLPLVLDSNGRRDLPLREALPKLRNDEQKDWPHEGPRGLQELLESVAGGPGNLVSYHLEWIRSSGVRDSTAQAHEHKHLCEALRLAVSLDQLDVSNLASMEHLARRLVQLETAVARNPVHPDYTGLSALADGPISSLGQARTPKFTMWVTERQKEQANIMRQQRLYAQELSDTSGGGKGGKSPGKGDGKDKRRKNKKEDDGDDE